MTPDAQRIAIAEACGAKWFDAPPSTIEASAWPKRVLSFKEPNFNRSPMPLAGPSGDAFWHDIIDYLNDLNAMHEAEKVLTIEKMQRAYYIDQLRITVGTEGLHSYRAYTATAAQRAEAFLKTLGLWRGDASNLSTVATDTVKTSNQ